MSLSTALRDLQRDLENKANDLGKIQKGRFPRFFSPFSMNIAKNHQLRKKYTIQLGENELVLKVCLTVSTGFSGHLLALCWKRLDAILQDMEDQQNNKREVVRRSYLNAFHPGY
ncbi:unnamed protein product [Thlaspi arvense]|uniref:Uncharacterized protein n=1 Tax=Thlaspi arvense TaxID=13288 RepID=A0AAU9R5X8_THLAR|nr:unnamed protein product [Thlaspi arvense]